ncbi:hypothetical protein DPMN_166016 [Dreissena polymorpha]|uniref:Uncharacterized protein n=1 Tax=Dreissena polymorpha TaxID=45954 RepID=A0A9D4EWD7_DREPO|nr:hypothetical protein DPMN_166016 [Dreissena polymorpha]
MTAVLRSTAVCRMENVAKPSETNRSMRVHIIRVHIIINILTKFDKDWMKTATSIINILIKFHKDWMKTVASTVYTSKLLTDAHTHTRTHIRAPDITRSHKLTMSLRDR